MAAESLGAILTVSLGVADRMDAEPSWRDSRRTPWPASATRAAPRAPAGSVPRRVLDICLPTPKGVEVSPATAPLWPPISCTQRERLDRCKKGFEARIARASVSVARSQHGRVSRACDRSILAQRSQDLGGCQPARRGRASPERLCWGSRGLGSPDLAQQGFSARAMLRNAAIGPARDQLQHRFLIISSWPISEPAEAISIADDAKFRKRSIGAKCHSVLAHRPGLAGGCLLAPNWLAQFGVDARPSDASARRCDPRSRISLVRSASDPGTRSWTRGY